MAMGIHSETTNHKRGSRVRKTTSIFVSAVLLVALSGCAFFDNEARDKAACDRLSDILTAQGDGTLPTDAPASFIQSIERDVLPLASGEFGRSIKDLIDSYRGLESQSIFDQFAGGLDTFYFAGIVLDRCVQISSKIPTTEG